jgi:hypothetical protein
MDDRDIKCFVGELMKRKRLNGQQSETPITIIDGTIMQELAEIDAFQNRSERHAVGGSAPVVRASRGLDRTESRAQLISPFSSRNQIQTRTKSRFTHF